MGSYAKALIAQSHHQMVAAQAVALMNREAVKGCLGDLAPGPVALEPVFEPIEQISDIFAESVGPHYLLEPSSPAQELVRLQIWMSPEPQEFDWNRMEFFHKLLLRVRRRVMLEVIGNCGGCQLILTCHAEDAPLVREAFRGVFASCELAPLNVHPFMALGLQAWSRLAFRDYYPDPPYSHLLTRPESLRLSPYEILISTLSGLDADGLGFYQALFQPTSADNRWHNNIQALINLEYAVQSIGNSGSMYRAPQQVPSASLQVMAGDAQRKAHDDKPIFALAMRVGLLGGAEPESALVSLSAFSDVYMHGGRPLRYLSHADYAAALPPQRIGEMFQCGLTYRPGFIVNSWELSGAVHLPPADLLAQRQFSLPYLETITPRRPGLFSGTMIGTCIIAGKETPIRIPLEIRKRHTHLLGKPDMGKSTTMKHMILADIQDEASVIVIDPHGDLVKDLLSLIPDIAAPRTILMDFSGPWVPLWNPLAKYPGMDTSRLATDIIGSIRSIVEGWGDRMENLLRNALLSLLELPRCTLADIYSLLHAKSTRSEQLRDAIMGAVEDPNLYEFWRQEFPQYRADELGPPKNKLSKMLLAGNVALMLSQPESLIDLKSIMDDERGAILLVDLSSVGNELKGVLGGFMLSLINQAALGRASFPEKVRHPCHVYCDEAHRFLTEAIHDLIFECRKFGVYLTLANQAFSQFPKKIADSIANAGTAIVFNVDSDDATRIKKNMRGLASAEDIIALEKGQAIVRVFTEVVRIQTLQPPAIPEKNNRQQIIDESHRRYYQPADQVRASLGYRTRDSRKPAPQSDADSRSVATGNIQELVFDEFS